MTIAPRPIEAVDLSAVGCNSCDGDGAHLKEQIVSRGCLLRQNRRPRTLWSQMRTLSSWLEAMMCSRFRFHLT